MSKFSISIVFIKAPIILADIIILFSLVKILKNNQKPLFPLTLYLSCPLVPMVFYLEGNLSILAFAFLILSFLLAHLNKNIFSGLAFGTAISIMPSLIFFALVILFSNKQFFKTFLAALIVFSAASAPFLSISRLLFSYQQRAKS